MDWSPSLSCSVSSSCPDPQDSSIADSSKDSDRGETSENGGVGDGAEAAAGTSLGMDTSTADLYFAPLPSQDGPPRSDLQDMYMDPRLTEHIVGLCLTKLQQASSGRHHSLLRQAQLKCMLHRIQMHTLFRPILDPCSPSYAYDPVFQGSNSTATVPLDSLQGYDWDQDLLDSNQLASSLSLDLLLSMGALAPSVDANLVSSTIDQGLFNLGQLVMPMEPFTSDFATLTTSAPTSTALADASSAQQQQQQQKQRIQSTPPPSDIKTIEQSTSAAAVTPALNGSSGAEPRPLPGQSYFDLLLATNSNETLSQLMSTSATPSGATSDLSLSALSPALATSAVDSQRVQGPQQTIPLTTKEIMDAFSGQFPIKLAEAVDSGPPVTTIETAGCPLPSPEASTPSPMEAVETLNASASVGQGPSEDGSENLHPDHASSEVSSCGEPLTDPSQVPPALIMHDNEEHDVVEAELTESMDVDLAIQDMTLKSPPPSPRKSRSGSSDRSPSPTRTCVHNQTKSRSNRRKSQVLRRRPKTLVHTPSLMERLSLAMMEDSQDSDSQLAGHMHTDTVDPLQDGDSEYDLAEEEYDDHHYPYKRRRASEDSSASSSSESSPESSPPSPRTPPPHDGQDYESSPPSPAHGPCESDLGQCTATTCIVDDEAKDLFLEKSGDKRKRPTEHGHTARDNDINHDGDMQIHRRIQSTETARPGMTPIMTAKDLVGVKAMVSLSSTTTSAVLAVESVLNLRHAQDGAETDVGVEEGDAAVAAGAASGILTSTVHSRYPLRRQSVRLLQRLSGRA